MLDLSKIIAETKKSALSAIKKNLKEDFSYSIEDVLQEVYLRIYKLTRKNYQIDLEKLNSFVYTIAKNESIRMNIKLQRQITKNRLAIETYVAHAAQNDLTSYREDLLELVERIPEPYRQTFLLFFYGYNIKEISQRLSIADGTVKSRISRAKEMLRKLDYRDSLRGDYEVS